ncbi:protein of unknown function [Paenibacillus alvei]|uniref:Uncharacterized protein n=1 Tax=Paenibacillus alvei TaxID=44250 RepID=A0A383RKH1_PAEAL|nr:protein of unknown function [Paenibacillus alvei]
MIQCLGKYILHKNIENERGELCGKKEMDDIYAALGTNGIAVISVRWFKYNDESSKG